jgi:hypothetical protein
MNLETKYTILSALELGRNSVCQQMNGDNPGCGHKHWENMESNLKQMDDAIALLKIQHTQYNECSCGDDKQTEPHKCPYECEINDNCDDKYCTCCDECQQHCSDEI